MSKIRYIIISILMLCLLIPESGAVAKKPKRNKKSKAEVSAPAPEKKKTPYEEFVSKKGVISKDGFMKIYRSGNDIWLEIPDSLVGRRVLLTAMVSSSSSPFVGKGLNLSSNSIYEIDRTDSLLLFKAPKSNLVISDSEPEIAKALNQSKSSATVMAFPIKYRNADTTASVVKVTKLFSHSNKKLVNFKGLSFDDLVVSSAEHKSSLSLFKYLVASENNVGICSESTFDLTVVIPGFGFESSEKPKVTVDLLSTLSLLPEGKMKTRKADDRIGTRNVAYTSFDSVEGTESDKWAARWNLEGDRSIRVYVDTLLPQAWRTAVKTGIEKWNDAFSQAGLGKKVFVEDYPSDAGFDAENPLISVVTFSGGSDTGLSAGLVQDPSTGEIMSARIMIPGEYVLGVRRASVFTISDVDERYSRYDLPEQAVCEYLASDIMGLFGRCVGLVSNAAGSAAYTPEQLLDPEFTAVHGLTSSVTDNVRFNYLARPGDKEKGVLIISDRLGTYDKYAVEWLYGDFAGKSEESLAKMLDSKDGNPEYLYLPQSGRSLDSRACATGLGNDSFAAFEAGMTHLKFVAENAGKWLGYSMPESYTTLFLDFLWLRYRDLTKLLISYIGALDSNEIRAGSSLPKMTTFPAEVQKKALEKLFASFADVAWMEKNRALITISGANKGVSTFTLMNAFLQSGVKSRLASVAMAEKMAGGNYSPETFLKDVRNIVLKNIRKGKLAQGEDTMILTYLRWLISLSDVMKQNYMNAVNPSGKSSVAFDEPSFRTNVQKVPSAYTEGIEELALLNLRSAKADMLRGLSAASDPYDAACIKYLVSVADYGLGNKK